MVAWVELALSTATKAITIPLIAIVRDEDGQPSVYVVNSDTGRAEARRLTVGRAFGRQVEVLDGVSAGEEIIVDGQHQLEVGQKILRIQEGR
jgi:multidrug efflux pump subunit AcrA (membrane-fusion protein)